MKRNGVICAIDVNDYDPNVIDLAATYARHFGVNLDVLHVTLFPDPATAAWPAYVGSPQFVIEDNQKLRTISTLVPDVIVRHHHVSGIPSTKILEFVKDNQPQLLVIGTHGRRGLSRLLGSVATELLRKAACPVLVLRELKDDPVPDEVSVDVLYQTGK